MSLITFWRLFYCRSFESFALGIQTYLRPGVIANAWSFKYWKCIPWDPSRNSTSCSVPIRPSFYSINTFYLSRTCPIAGEGSLPALLIRSPLLVLLSLLPFIVFMWISIHHVLQPELSYCSASIFKLRLWCGNGRYWYATSLGEGYARLRYRDLTGECCERFLAFRYCRRRICDLIRWFILS